MSDAALEHCAKHNDGVHRFGDRLLYTNYAKCECGVRRTEIPSQIAGQTRPGQLLPPLPEQAKAPSKPTAAMEALLLLVEAKRLHDSMEAYPNVCGGALNEAKYKDLKRRGWDLAFQLVDQHKKETGT